MTTTPLCGAAYRAVVRLTNKAGAVLADVGDTCEKVPALSLRWLLEQGLIVPVTPAQE
jgi:hypothetical protein